MATTEEADPRTEGRLRRVDLVVRPESRFPVPQSDGYTVYSALLSALERTDADASARVHDSPLGSLHSGESWTRALASASARSSAARSAL